MPSNLEQAVQDMVNEAVAAALAPYAEILNRFQSLMAPTAAKRGPGRPPKVAGIAAPVKAKAKAKSGRKARKAKVAVSLNTFKAGDSVAYKQGRGTFGATVIELDGVTGLLVLERASDGKRILRKPSTIEATGAAPVAEEAKVEAEAVIEEKPAKKAKRARKSKAKKGKKAAKAKVQPTEG